MLFNIVLSFLHCQNCFKEIGEKYAINRLRDKGRYNAVQNTQRIKNDSKVTMI